MQAEMINKINIKTGIKNVSSSPKNFSPFEMRKAIPNMYKNTSVALTKLRK